MAEEYDRYASFVERYVIARAPHFRAGFEKEDGWAATKDAETLFNTIKRQTQLRNDAERAEASQGQVAIRPIIKTGSKVPVVKPTPFPV